jgi:hypothetical protein
MKFAIYHREREYAREMGDPKLAEVEASTQEEAERMTAQLGATGTLAVPVAPSEPQPSTINHQPAKWLGVFFDGPQPDQDHEGEEIPVWLVYVGDEEAEPVDTVYHVYSFARAQALAEHIAKDRRLELIHEATPA